MALGFYKATTQVVIVGFLAFCGPGLYNALTSLGNAGSQTEGTSAVANGTLYTCFAIVGYFSGVFFNLWGPKLLMCLGGLAYAIYALCIYYVLPNRLWLAAIGGIVLGIGAGLFWTAQSALMMGYATEDKKGRYIAIFWTIFNLGGVVGGFIQFGLNFNNVTLAANKASYFTFIALMTLGSVCSLFLLASPSKVIKDDGSMVQFKKADSAKQELKDALAAIKDKFVLCMLLFFFASNWYYTYQFSGFNGLLFNVRTRGFNSAFYWGSQMGGSMLSAAVCDHHGWSLGKRAKAGFWLNFGFLVLGWTGAVVCTYATFGGFWDKPPYLRPNYDMFDDTSQWIGPFIVFMLMGFSDAIYQSYAYWLMGAAAGDSMRQAARYAAVYKGVQSAGAAVAWSTDLIDEFLYRQQVWVCVALALLSCVPAFFCVKGIETIAARSHSLPVAVSPPPRAEKSVSLSPAAAGEIPSPRRSTEASSSREDER